MKLLAFRPQIPGLCRCSEGDLQASHKFGYRVTHCISYLRTDLGGAVHYSGRLKLPDMSDTCRKSAAALGLTFFNSVFGKAAFAIVGELQRYFYILYSPSGTSG